MPDAYELALQALGRKERTEAELEGWLRERGVGEDELAEAIARLAEAGAVDDERFARSFAEDKRELRGWGPERIAEALRARGVSEALVQSVAVESEADAVSRAAALLVESGAEVEDDGSRGRALALLARRGYPLEVAYEAVRAAERAAE
jgi:regulatory protein